MTPTEQTEAICRTLIPLIVQKQEELNAETGQHFLLTIDVPALTVLSILPVFVAAVENLAEDLVPEAYEGAMTINQELLTQIINGYGEAGPEEQFNVVATLREAGVDIDHVLIDGEKIDIPRNGDAS